MTKLFAQEKDSEFEEMIKWYNSQVFDWFNPTGKGDDSGSSGIDEVMNQMENLDMYEPDEVCYYYYFYHTSSIMRY